MNAQTELPEVDAAYQDYMAATDDLDHALKTHSKDIAKCRREHTRCLAALIDAETRAGFSRKVPLRTPKTDKTRADYTTAAKAYRRGERTLTGLDVPRLEAEKSVWRRALCAATHQLPHAFPVEYCRSKIKHLSEAIITAKNSALVRNLKF